jgi:hypothetical protein
MKECPAEQNEVQDFRPVTLTPTKALTNFFTQRTVTSNHSASITAAAYRCDCYVLKPSIIVVRMASAKSAYFLGMHVLILNVLQYRPIGPNNVGLHGNITAWLQWNLNHDRGQFYSFPLTRGAWIAVDVRQTAALCLAAITCPLVNLLHVCALQVRISRVM